MWLNRHDDPGWRAIARDTGVSEHIALLLWKRAEAAANNDRVKAERAFRRMLEDAKALDLLALELEANHRGGADPGRSTRVLVEERRSPGTAGQPAHDPSMSPATRLRVALETAIQRGENLARSIAVSDARTITEAIRRLGRQSGSPLAAIDPNALAQLLRLADALVTIVEQGRDAGKTLPGGLRSELESRIGADLGDLRVHDDPTAAAEARRHDALAFAQGTDVYFADGMYDPSSASGKRLIAHEATHVVQQRGGGRAASGAMSEPGGAVEREADRVANAFAAGMAPGAREFAVSERAAAGTISRKATTADADPAAAPTGPTEWKITLLGQVLDLSAKLAGARDVGGGQKQIDINQNIGPLRIQSVKYKASADKVESGTLVASVDSGVFKGTQGSLTVTGAGQVSGKLRVPINTPGLFTKEISVEVGGSTITGKATLAPGDFKGPDFSIKTSNFEVTVTSSGSGLSVGLTGSAEVSIDNGMAQGGAKMDVALKADSSGVTFDATINGKITIAGIAETAATLKYDGSKVEITAGAKIPVDLPGLAGNCNIHYEKGKLSVDSTDLRFTVPQLEPIKFDEVKADQAKLAAKLHLASPLNIPLPGGASLTLEQSMIAIDGKDVKGDITGTFALNNDGGLKAKVTVAYDKGQIKGTVDVTGGAKFNVGGVDITIDNSSKLSVADGFKVSGDVAGKIKLPNVPEIAVHVVAQPDGPIDLTCDAHIPINSLTKQLGGDLHVTYKRGGGANAFSLEATNVSVAAAPINNQVLFSKFEAHIKNNEITGELTAASGTVIKANGVTVTIQGGFIHLKPGRVLEGQLKATGEAAGSTVEADVAWKNNKLEWKADAEIDLAQVTNKQVIGKARVAADSGGAGKLTGIGAITFGAPALQGVAIKDLSADKEKKNFHFTIDANQALAEFQKKLPGVHIEPTTTAATVDFTASKGLTFNAVLEGKASLPKSGTPLAEGRYHLSYENTKGFTGKIDEIQIKASEYFHATGGSADIENGEVIFGTATFEVPNIAKGTVQSQINVKTGKFHLESQVEATALKGLKVKVTLDNDKLSATLQESSAPIALGQFGTLTVGGGSTVTLAKGAGMTADINGTLAFNGQGSLAAKMHVAINGGKVTGSIDVTGGAKLSLGGVDITIDSGSKLSLADGFQVSGDVAGKIKLGNLADIAVHVVVKPGQPLELTCDARIPLNSISPQLGGELHVTYKRGGGPDAFSLEATDVAVTAAPINNQVVFSKFEAHIQGNDVTGLLTAKPGTVIQASGVKVTIQGGFVRLKPGRILEGELKATGEAAGSTIDAEVSWKNDKLEWKADAEIDLARITNNQVIGKARVAADSGGAGKLAQIGPITFAAPALQGVAIKDLSADKEKKNFHFTIDANQALAEVQKKLPGVKIEPTTTQATVDFTAGKALTFNAVLEGKATLPKSGTAAAAGRYHFSYENTKGFTGKIDDIQITASEYFHSTGGHADIEDGVVVLGNATFEVPGVAKGTVKADLNLKTDKFHIESEVEATALKGLKFKVTLDNDKLSATVLENSAPIPLGQFATLTVGGGSTVTLAKGAGMTADINGTLAVNNQGSLAAKMHVAVNNGQITGSIDVTGGAKFNLGGVDITIDNGSKLTVASGFQVSGDISGKIKLPNLADLAVHVVVTPGQPLDVKCDATIPLAKLTPQLAGDLHVKYTRGGGANAFSLDAANIKVFSPPINGQVVFSKFEAQFKDNDIKGLLTANPGTVIAAAGAKVTIQSGFVRLKPGRILEGKLKATGEAAGSIVEAQVEWKNNKLDWSAEGDFDVGPLTNFQIIGKVHAAAGSNGVGKFVQNGELHFAPGPLSGIKIKELSGDKSKGQFHAVIEVSDAINEVQKKLPGVNIESHTGSGTIDYAPGPGLTFATKLEGKVSFPKSGTSQLEGKYHVSYENTKGFTGKIDEIKLTASDYFHVTGGSADFETGIVSLGTATFEVPKAAKGVVTGEINLKSSKLHLESEVEATAPALAGIKIKVTLDNTANSLSAKLVENSPAIELGKFATLRVGADSTVTLAKATGLTVDVKGLVDAHGLGNGTFHVHYQTGQNVTGDAKVHVNPFAMFDAIDLDMKLDEQRQLSTNQAVVLQLASQYQGAFNADAKVNVKANQFVVEGHVTELKDLGSVSEAFRKGGGAEIKWDQAAHTVTVTDDFDLDTAMPDLGEGSTLHMQYVGKVLSVKGTLVPKSYPGVTFSAGSHITGTWSSDTKRFEVQGKAQADIEKLCIVDFDVEAGLAGGQPGAFGLRGHIDATKLGQKIKGIDFSSVTANFSVLIGSGKRADLDFHLNAQISGIPAAGVTDIAAHLDASYKTGQGISGELAVTRAKLGEVIADGKITVANNRFQSGSVHLTADFPQLKIEGTGTVSAGEMGELNTAADLKVTPGGTSVLAKFIQSGNIHVDIKQWKLANATGKLNLVPPDFLPIENPVIEVGYTPGAGLHATLTTQFNAPMAKNGEKGTFVAGYDKTKGLYAHIEFPVTVPGFQQAKVTGDLDQKGIHVGATLIPKDASIVKEAKVSIGYDVGGGFYIEGSITLKPTESLELVVGLRYDSKKGLQVMGITPNDKAATPDEHEIANWHKDFPTIPLATIGVASLGLKFGMGVAAGYRMPRIAFKNPQLEGGLEALDKGGMPAFTFGGSIAMGAYITLSLSVQVVGEIQLLIASCDAGIGAEIAARLNLDLGADVNGRFAPGQGAHLDIDPFVGASLDLIASLIATLHAEICWFTIVDKKWTLASANFAHIDLGRFHPFNPVGLQIGGPGGTHLTNGLSLRDDAFESIKEGVKQGGQHAGDEEANRDARERVAPVLKSFRAAAGQFEQLPEGWQNGMVAPPVDFHSMFPVSNEQWDFYQDHADQAETLDPADACTSPTQKLAKAVAVTARRDPMGAGRLILAWRRAQIAHMGINPDTGVNVVEERELVQAHIEAKYQADLLEAQQKQKKQDEEHAAAVAKQAADYKKAEDAHVQTSHQQKKAHEGSVSKTQDEWNKAQTEKTKAAQHAKQEGAAVQHDKEVKAPPPAKPPEPPMPKPLAKPAPIPVPPPVPLPAPPEVLPAVTLPALPSDPGVSVHAAAAIPPTQKKAAAPESPGAKQAPKGGTPDPMPGTSSNAKQVGGGGGGKANLGGGTSGGKSAPSGGSTSAAPRPGPAVAAGPDGIISQQRTLDAKEAALSGKAAPGAAGKPGTLGKLPGGPTGPAPAAGGKTPAATAPGGAAPGGKGAPGAAPTADPKGATTATTAGGVDASVQKVVDQGKTDEAAYKSKLEQQDKTYSTNVKEKDKITAQETQRLEKEAEEAKKRKEREKAAAEARAAGANANANATGHPALGPDGKPLDKKPKKPIGTRVPLAVDGESHTLYVDDASGMAMVASEPTPVSAKAGEVSNTASGAPLIKPLAASSAQQAKTGAQQVTDLAAKANAGDETANTALISAQQALGNPLKITWAWAKVAIDPAVAGGSIEKPLLHPYFPTFKGRVGQLSAAGHISTVDPTQFAESIWTKICQGVKAAHPAMNDPAAYSNFAKGWLNMKSPEFLSAIAQFEHIGKELAKAGSAGFAKARNFGFWSKEEGRSLAEATSDLTLETSAIGGLMDGLPTLNAKGSDWDPEIWGALSNAYANAVVPELLKGKKVNVCVGAGVPAGNIWDAVESAALAKGLKGTKLTLDSVCTHYAAAAKDKANRRILNDTKQTNGVKGCLFVGERAGAISAADAYFKTLDQPAVTTAQAGTTPGATPPGAQPGAEPGKPLPPGAPIGTRVPMKVGTEGHTQYIDPATGKPMVASTPTPVTSKLAELNSKLATLPARDPKKADAVAEIAKAQGLEAKVADLAQKVKDGTATTAQLEAEQAVLAASVAKIWDIADPGPMDAAKAKEVIEGTAPDCADLAKEFVPDWVGKPRSDFEKKYIDVDVLRRDMIAKYVAGSTDKSKLATVGCKDPIAAQKFKDIDAEKHIDDAKWPGLKDQFYTKMGAEIAKPAYTDRTRTYQAMKDAAGFSFNCKGTTIPADRISPISSRNHSVEKLYDNAKSVAATVTAIDKQIEESLKGSKPAKIAAEKLKEPTRRKAYRHILKSHAKPIDTLDKTKNISDYPTWYAPGEIKVDTHEPPNKEFAKMMTLGALQPEWYPGGTAVLKIDHKLRPPATRTLFKPTAFDGLMSSLWTARNMTENDYGVTGGGLGEFLEADVKFNDVDAMTIIIPSDDFLADMQRVATEVQGKEAGSTPTEELLRGNEENTRILNTTVSKPGNPPRSGVKDMYGQITDRSTQEQNTPGAAPTAPGAAQPSSTAKPEKPAAAQGGAYDRIDGPHPDAVVAAGHPPPIGTPKPAAAPVGLSPTSQAPGVPQSGATVAPSQGGAQANDGRTTAQTAAGATASTDFGAKPGESVADAAARLHPKSERDSHFNPKEKVAFERALGAALLANAGMYSAQVERVSTAILNYFNQRLVAGVTKGVEEAHQKYVTDLASLTSGSKPGWWGAVEIAAGATKEELAAQTRQALTQGTLPQKMAIHQNFIEVLKEDFKEKVAQAFLGASAVDPWYVRQQTKLKNGALDKNDGVNVFEHKAERGRVERPDTKAVSPAGPGIEARGSTGVPPTSALPAGADSQQVYRGLDSFTMDEAKAFCQRARLKVNMPLAAGVSGSTAELMNVAMTMGLTGLELQKYAVAVLAYIGGGGNHSYHEIAVVLAAAGLKIDPDNYSGVEKLVGTALFEELKSQHPDAFRDSGPDVTGPPTTA